MRTCVGPRPVATCRLRPAGLGREGRTFRGGAVERRSARRLRFDPVRLRIRRGALVSGCGTHPTRCRASASGTSREDEVGAGEAARRSHGWGALALGAAEAMAMLGTVGGAVAVLVGCDAALGVLPVVLPFAALLARQYGDRARARGDRWRIGLANQLAKQESLISATSGTVAKLESEAFGNSGRRLLVVEGKLSTVEAALLSTGERMREAVDGLQGLSNAFRDGAELQYQASVYGIRRELQQALQQWTSAQTEAVQALSNRILLLEDAVRMVEANQADSWSDVSEGLRTVHRTKDDVSSLSQFMQNEFACILEEFKDSMARTTEKTEIGISGTVPIDPQQWSSLGMRLRAVEDRLADLNLQIVPKGSASAEGGLGAQQEAQDNMESGESASDQATGMGVKENGTGKISHEQDMVNTTTSILQELAREITALKNAVQGLELAELDGKSQATMQATEQGLHREAVEAGSLSNRESKKGKLGTKRPDDFSQARCASDAVSGPADEGSTSAASAVEGVDGSEAQLGSLSGGISPGSSEQEEASAKEVVKEQQWVARVSEPEASGFEEESGGPSSESRYAVDLGRVMPGSSPASGEWPPSGNDRAASVFGVDFPDDPPGWVNRGFANGTVPGMAEMSSPLYTEGDGSMAGYAADYVAPPSDRTWTTDSPQMGVNYTGDLYSGDLCFDDVESSSSAFPNVGPVEDISSPAGLGGKGDSGVDAAGTSEVVLPVGMAERQDAGIGPVEAWKLDDEVGDEKLGASSGTAAGDALSMRMPGNGIADGLAQLKEGRAAVQYDFGQAHQLLYNALGCFEEILEGAPENLVALGNSGNALLALGDLKVKMAIAMNQSSSLEAGRQAAQEGDELLTM
eukprot:evm.model.scf_2401.2 EVM.evm.TU.scf_2401.2   scf_2401:16389-24003(+)